MQVILRCFLRSVGLNYLEAKPLSCGEELGGTDRFNCFGRCILSGGRIWDRVFSRIRVRLTFRKLRDFDVGVTSVYSSKGLQYCSVVDSKCANPASVSVPVFP